MIRSTRIRPGLVLVLVLALAGIIAPVGLSDAEAQTYYRPYRSHTRVVAIYPRGMYVGGGLATTRVLHQQGGAELLTGGSGISLFAGFRASDRLSLELSWLGTLHNPQSVQTGFGEDVDYLMLNGFTADARVYVGGQQMRIEPFVQGGVGVYLLDSTYFGAQSVGTGFQLGGGFDLPVATQWDLTVRALYRGMAMGPPDGGENDTYVSGATVEASVGFQF